MELLLKKELTKNFCPGKPLPSWGAYYEKRNRRIPRKLKMKRRRFINRTTIAGLSLGGFSLVNSCETDPFIICMYQLN